MKAIFFDRDGTLIKEKHYLNCPDEVELEKNVVPALLLLKQHGFDFFIVTNQSGIAQKKIKLHQFLATQTQLFSILESYQLYIKAFYYCPHHPTKGIGDLLKTCDCRKPSPGMLLKALKEHSINPQLSFMIGDKPADILAGQRANLKSILVKTGYGKTFVSSPDCIPSYIGVDLLDVVENFILK